MNKLMMSILAVGMTVLSVACAKTEQAKPPVESSSKPNIVVVVADDMGWGDSATFGNELIQTPNMDRLAAQGVKLTQCYSACGVCSPSRSAILTGRTPYRNGVWRHLSGNGTEEDAKRIVPEDETRYPEQFFFGVLPAWGAYIRHARNIEFRNVKMTARAPDKRERIVLDDVVSFRDEK